MASSSQRSATSSLPASTFPSSTSSLPPTTTTGSSSSNGMSAISTTSATTTTTTSSATDSLSTTSSATMSSSDTTKSTPSSRSSTTTSSTSSTSSTTSTTTSSSTTSTSSTTSSTDTSTSTTSTTTTTTTSTTSIFTTTDPVTTTHVLPTTTLHSTVYITTTDGQGSTTITAPNSFTSLLTSTASNGAIVTITQVQINPTLNSNNKGDSASSAFFSNTGAVAGTFILVGLTSASLLLWSFFFVRRRRRRRRMEHDSAVSATLAAAGLYRTPLDDDDAPKTSSYRPSGDVEMNQRPSSRLDMATVHSQPSNGRMSAYFDAPEPENGESFNPYAEFGVPAKTKDGYIPARTSSPEEHYRDRHGSTSTTGFIKGHSASGSYEPLLSSYYRQSAGSPPSPTVPLVPLAGAADQNKEAAAPADLPRESAKSSLYDSEGTDDRLDPNIRKRLESGGDNASARDLRDEEDYSRPVLLVRNLPDETSRES